MPIRELASVRAVLFDVYGTLVRIPVATRPYRQLVEHAREQGLEIGPDVAATIMRRNMTLAQTAQWLGVALSADEAQALERALTQELDGLQLFPEVPAVLTTLRARGYRLGVCSNLAFPYLAPAYQLLAPLIDVTIWSCEVGLMKPDPEIYRLAAGRLGIPADEVLMVGDTYSADVGGPRAAGMKALLLDRRTSPAAGSLSTLARLL